MKILWGSRMRINMWILCGSRMRIEWGMLISRGWIKWELNMIMNGKNHGFMWSYYLQSVAHSFLVPARSHGVKMAWKRAGLLLDDKKTHEARARWRERRRPSFKELSTGSLDLITCVSCVHMVYVFDRYHAAPEKPWISKVSGWLPDYGPYPADYDTYLANYTPSNA